MIPLYVSKNGTYRAEQGYAFDPVVVNVQEEVFRIRVDLGDSMTTPVLYSEFLENKDKKIYVDFYENDELVMSQQGFTTYISVQLPQSADYGFGVVVPSVRIEPLDEETPEQSNNQLIIYGYTSTPDTPMSIYNTSTPIPLTVNEADIVINGTINTVDDKHTLVANLDDDTFDFCQDNRVKCYFLIDCTVNGQQKHSRFSAYFNDEKLVGYGLIDTQWFKITINKLASNMYTTDLWIDEETKYTYGS